MSILISIHAAQTDFEDHFSFWPPFLHLGAREFEELVAYIQQYVPPADLLEGVVTFRGSRVVQDPRENYLAVSDSPGTSCSQE